MRDDAATKLTERYDREAVPYRDLWAPVLRKAGLGLVRELADGPVRHVLDIGTGVGALLPDLRASFPGAFVLGVDRSRGMLALAPPQAARAVMDATQLALADASVDRVFLVFMLFHLESPAAGLGEARRVLCAGGRVGTLTWASDLESTATRIWAECLDDLGAAPLDPLTAARHDPVDSPEKVAALLREAEFKSARAWTDVLVHALDTERLIRLRTTLGSVKTRYDSLAPAARETCLAEARRRMMALAPADFEARVKVVYAVASA